MEITKNLPYMEITRNLPYGYAIPSVSDLLMAKPTADVQITLAIIHSFIWFYLINKIFVPIIFWIYHNMKSKQRFLYFNRRLFKKAIGWDIGGDENEQKLAIARIDAAMVQHLVGAILCFPSGFGFGHLLPTGVATAMACQANLCELGWEIEDTLMRIYEIIFGGERGRKFNPPSLMLTLVAHHTAAWCMAIPINMYYPNCTLQHEGLCILQFGVALNFLCQKYGFTLDVANKRDLIKMKILCTIVFVTVIWTRLFRYTYIGITMLVMAYTDENFLLFKLMLVPTIFLSLFNVIVVKDATKKFLKFWSMDTGTTPKLQRQNTRLLSKIYDMKGSLDHNEVRPLYPEIGSVMDVSKTNSENSFKSG